MATFLTTANAALRLGLKASTLKRWRVRGGGPPFHRLGRRIVYRDETLDNWAQRAEYRSTSEYAEPHAA